MQRGCAPLHAPWSSARSVRLRRVIPAEAGIRAVSSKDHALWLHRDLTFNSLGLPILGDCE
jgi:hypothetical protein